MASVKPISADEEAEKIFKMIDTDHDGMLYPEEILSALKKTGLPHRPKDVEEFMKAVDTDASGSISLEEFKDHVRRRHLELRVLFDKLDVNQNGFIEIAEIKDSLEKLKMPNDDPFVNKLMKRIDKDGDGIVSFDEWVELLLLVPNLEIESVFQYWEEATTLWSNTEVPLIKEKTANKQMLGMLCGAIAGVIAKTATAPLERLKVIYQVQINPPPMLTVLKNIWKESGWRGFYRSNGTNLLKIAPEMGIKFWTFEVVKNFFSEDEEGITTYHRLLAGGVAGVVAHTVVFPLDVVKTRLAATSGNSKHYHGVFSTVRNIQKTEGYWFPFFRGWVPMVISAFPGSSLSLGVFSTLKALVESYYPDQPISSTAVAACSTTSSIFGSLTVYPLSVIKSRLQVQGMEGKPKEYNGAVDVILKTYRREGLIGFYRGIFATMLKHVPSQTIAFVSYDTLRKYFGLEKKHKH